MPNLQAVKTPRAPDPMVEALREARKAAEPFRRPLYGWQMRCRYLAARIGSRYSSTDEVIKAVEDLRVLQQKVQTLHRALQLNRPDTDTTGTLGDVDAALARLETDIADVLQPARNAEQ